MTKLLVQVGGLAISAALAAGLMARREKEAAVAPPPVAQVAALSKVESGPRMVALKADARGHFSTDVSIGGQFLKVLVDTGASSVALTHEDARKAGISPPRSAYTVVVQTANGKAMAASVRIPELRLQSLTLRDVEAVVMPQGALSVTLLGMSFLKRLKSFEMNGNTLALKQ